MTESNIELLKAWVKDNLSRGSMYPAILKTLREHIHEYLEEDDQEDSKMVTWICYAGLMEYQAEVSIFSRKHIPHHARTEVVSWPPEGMEI